MVRNIIITTLRFFLRHKAYSFTNIFGLAVGLATCILIFLFVQDELSYDRFFTDSDRIYRLEPYFLGEGEESHWAASQGNLLPSVLDRYPEIESGVKFHKSFGASVLRNGDRIFREEGVIFADSAFFDVFSFRMLAGDPKTALSGPGKIVLTESCARKYFGDEDAMGKSLVTDRKSYVVSGVMQDTPENCHLHFGLLVSLDDLRATWATLDQAGPSTFYSYIKLSRQASLKDLKDKIKQDIWSIYGYTVTGDSANIPEDFTADLILQPVTSIHLDGHAEKELVANSDRQYIVIFTVVALFVLVIACINYMNLATARSSSRGKEIGIKKVIGASRNGIFNQFMGESFVMTLLAMILALLVVASILPSYNVFTGKSLELDLLSNFPLLLTLFGIWIIVSILSGSYPAFFLSGFNPLKVLYSSTGNTQKGRSTLNLRRGLVVFQFAISILMIIGSLTVYKQLHFIREKNLGFNKENVIVLPLAGSNDPQKLEVFRNSLLSDPEVVSACGSSSIPGVRMHFLTIRMPDIEQANAAEDGGDGTLGIRTLSTDVDVVKTFGLEVAQGRGFSLDYPNDPQDAFLLNEAAVKFLGIEGDPVGQRIEYTYNLPEPKKGRVVGILKDFHYESLHTAVEPLMIHVYPYYHRYLSIRYDTKDIPGLTSRIQDKWQAVFPDVPFDHFFLDTYYNNLYKAEINMSTIITYFTLLAILIACLGLFGLASFTTEQRTREIGIRKVLGASSIVIIRLISREFVVLLLISNIIAWLPAWYFLNRWLDGFVFRTNISWWLFLVSAVISMVTALTIVGFQSFRSSRMNPVDAIRAC
jgi:putative ABC transport system permease protein